MKADAIADSHTVEVDGAYMIYMSRAAEGAKLIEEPAYFEH